MEDVSLNYKRELKLIILELKFSIKSLKSKLKNNEANKGELNCLFKNVEKLEVNFKHIFKNLNSQDKCQNWKCKFYRKLMLLQFLYLCYKLNSLQDDYLEKSSEHSEKSSKEMLLQVKNSFLDQLFILRKVKKQKKMILLSEYLTGKKLNQIDGSSFNKKYGDYLNLLQQKALELGYKSISQYIFQDKKNLIKVYTHNNDVDKVLKTLEHYARDLKSKIELEFEKNNIKPVNGKYSKDNFKELITDQVKELNWNKYEISIFSGKSIIEVSLALMSRVIGVDFKIKSWKKDDGLVLEVSNKNNYLGKVHVIFCQNIGTSNCTLIKANANNLSGRHRKPVAKITIFSANLYLITFTNFISFFHELGHALHFLTLGRHDKVVNSLAELQSQFLERISVTDSFLKELHLSLNKYINHTKDIYFPAHHAKLSKLTNYCIQQAEIVNDSECEKNIEDIYYYCYSNFLSGQNYFSHSLLYSLNKNTPLNIYKNKSVSLLSLFNRLSATVRGIWQLRLFNYNLNYKKLDILKLNMDIHKDLLPFPTNLVNSKSALKISVGYESTAYTYAYTDYLVDELINKPITEEFVNLLFSMDIDNYSENLKLLGLEE